MILDEPTVGLDPVLRADLWKMFSQLAATGLCLVVSSHVMDEAMRCDEILLLREGKLLGQMTPAALMESTGAENPEDAFVSLIAAGGTEQVPTQPAPAPRHRATPGGEER